MRIESASNYAVGFQLLAFSIAVLIRQSGVLGWFSDAAIVIDYLLLLAGILVLPLILFTNVRPETPTKSKWRLSMAYVALSTAFIINAMTLVGVPYVVEEELKDDVLIALADVSIEPSQGTVTATMLLQNDGKHLFVVGKHLYWSYWLTRAGGPVEIVNWSGGESPILVLRPGDAGWVAVSLGDGKVSAPNALKGGIKFVFATPLRLADGKGVQESLVAVTCSAYEKLTPLDHSPCRLGFLSAADLAHWRAAMQKYLS